MTMKRTHRTDELENLLSTAEVAEVLGISPKQVLKLNIPQMRLGARTVRFALADVEQFMADQMVRVSKPDEEDGP